MNSNYGYDLALYANKPEKVHRLLAQFLNNNHLGLLLGAGVSLSMGLPCWYDLVQAVTDKALPGRFDSTANYTNSDLKEIIDDVKSALPQKKDYLPLVSDRLYDGVQLDFDLEGKELLIAISGLMVGKTRGNVNHVITYNFDSVLEWYLGLLGLRVDTFTKREFLKKNADVTVAHLHGYLPFVPAHGKPSKEIIFSDEEFIDRQMSKDYWKEYYYEFIRQHTFLSVGLSAESIYKDVCPYLRQMDVWYDTEKVSRLLPYGVAFLTPGAGTDKYMPKLLEQGIIPCVFDRSAMPKAILGILQQAIA